MNATERARRSDSLYYDTQVTNRRALCDMIANLESDLTESKAENAKLREQMERLVTLLRVDCDIDASWDGLRRFWSIGLTEDGCLMRDRACKAEAENAKLRELVRDMVLLAGLNGCDVTKMQMHAHGGDWRTVWERMSELGVPGTGVE